MKSDAAYMSKSEMISTIQTQQDEIIKLKKQIAVLQAKLENRELKFENVGTLAEASAVVNEMFTAAQATADTYLENIKKLEGRSQEVLDEMEKKAEGIIAEAENVALKRIASAEAEATRKEIEGSEIVAEAERKAQKILSDTDAEVEEKWKIIEKRLLSMYESHQGLREIVESGIFTFSKNN